ncbi:MAG: hypothetical protein ACLPJH_08255 [Myxococcaceae bacterium]
MTRFRGALALGLLAAVAALFGCSKPAPPPPPPAPVQAPVPPPPPPPPPFAVTVLELGKAIGIDNRVTSPADTFGPKDTIYLAVVSEGIAPSVGLHAKWTFGPKAILVNDSTQTIAAAGPKATEFHIQKHSGWPVGQYTVELFVDGKSAGSKQFQVVAKAPAKKK